MVVQGGGSKEGKGGNGLFWCGFSVPFLPFLCRDARAGGERGQVPAARGGQRGSGTEAPCVHVSACSCTGARRVGMAASENACK